MKNKLAFSFSIISILLLFSIKLHAQPWFYSPFIPPDTTHYLVTNWAGKQEWIRRPPDSLMIPGVIVVKFRRGTLDSSILSRTYGEYFYGHSAKHKGGIQPLSGPLGPYDEPGQPRGFWPALRQQLFAERFWFDSSNNIVKDSILRSFIIANGGHWLRRFTAASPLDTLSVTRDGDTIGCDLPYCMVMSFDSTINPIMACYALLKEFPNDIANASPDYHMGEMFGHPASDQFLTRGCERNIDLIKADTAWNYEVGDTGVIVAPIELGIFFPHPDFGGDSTTGPGHKFVGRWNFYLENDSVYDHWLDYGINDDHGTAMCGIIGALTNNRIGFLHPNDSSVAGIAGGHGTQPPDAENLGRGVSMLALTWYNNAVLSTWAPAMYEAAAKSPVTAFGFGANVINNSLGFGFQTEWAGEALNYAYANSVEVVVAKGEQGTGDTIERTYPADYPDPWRLTVGGSVVEYPMDTLPMKIQQSDFGYDMDIIAPAGSTDDCGGWDLNYTTGKVETNPPSYESYGGTSSAAANATGSVALLVSVDHRLDSNALRMMEPEDYHGMIKAAAWRGDPGRMSDSAKRNSWVDSSGYGHLNIGNVFKMRDMTYARGQYFLMHYAAVGLPALDTSSWFPSIGTYRVDFTPPWNIYGCEECNNIDSFQRHQVLLPINLINGYQVRRRVLTFTDTLLRSLENSDTIPLFVWGRSGGPPPEGEGDSAMAIRSGWDFSSSPNYENGWTQVANGLGGSPDSLVDGIFAPKNGIITLRTVQYDVWSWNDSTNNYSNYLGHFPNDSNVGMNWTVFGRTKIPLSAVRESNPNNGSDSLTISVNPEETMVTANYFTASDLSDIHIEMYDILGRELATSGINYASTGWNSVHFPVSTLASGTYYVSVMGGVNSVVKSFVMLK